MGDQQPPNRPQPLFAAAGVQLRSETKQIRLVDGVAKDLWKMKQNGVLCDVSIQVFIFFISLQIIKLFFIVRGEDH